MNKKNTYISNHSLNLAEDRATYDNYERTKHFKCYGKKGTVRYLNDSQSEVAKRFWQEVSEIRIDPLNRVIGVSLPKRNKLYKEFGFREAKNQMQYMSAYATHKIYGTLEWLWSQDEERKNKRKKMKFEDIEPKEKDEYDLPIQ